jgi:hypothetical protein
MSRPIHAIAREIRVDWVAQGKRFPAAQPYLDAMFTLDSINDKFIADSGKSIVLYFLCNVGTWRGETARRIKAELKALVK